MSRKYNDTELEILKKEGKKGLKKYHDAHRKQVSTAPTKIIELQKYKEKYKHKAIEYQEEGEHEMLTL